MTPRSQGHGGQVRAQAQLSGRAGLQVEQALGGGLERSCSQFGLQRGDQGEGRARPLGLGVEAPPVQFRRDLHAGQAGEGRDQAAGVLLER